MQNVNSDLKINLNTNDLLLEDGNLVFTEDARATRQRIQTKVQTFLGEWFLNENIGVDYYGEFFQKNPEVAVIETILANEVLSTPRVTEISSIDLEYIEGERVLTGTITARTLDGDVSVDVETT